MSMTNGTLSIARHSLVAIAITAAFITLCLYFVDIGKFRAALNVVDLRYLAAVTGLAILIAILRATRVAVVVRHVSAPAVFKASFLHGAANAVLPARIGEAVLPITLARFGVVDAASGAGLLILIRLCDFAALVGGALILLVTIDQQHFSVLLSISAAIAGLALFVIILTLPILTCWLASHAPASLLGISQRLTRAAMCLTANDRIMLLILTLAIWLTLGIAGQVAVAAVGMNINYAPVWLACTAASLAFATPTNGFASLGPFEAAFVGVLGGYGQPVAGSLVSALSLHAGALLAAGVTAGVAAFLPGKLTGGGVPNAHAN